MRRTIALSGAVSYITARLQTLDRGAPISSWTVAGEVGHSSTDMEDVYGHLGQVRHRAKVVEYRVAQHKRILGGRLKAVCRNVRQTEPVFSERDNRKSLQDNEGL